MNYSSVLTTTDAEAFFSLLKRGIVGSFHHVSKKHLHRYCNEFSFRWNYRNDDDASCTIAAIRAGDGKRLMYQAVRAVLITKESPPSRG